MGNRCAASLPPPPQPTSVPYCTLLAPLWRDPGLGGCARRQARVGMRDSRSANNVRDVVVLGCQRIGRGHARPRRAGGPARGPGRAAAVQLRHQPRRHHLLHHAQRLSARACRAACSWVRTAHCSLFGVRSHTSAAAHRHADRVRQGDAAAPSAVTAVAHAAAQLARRRRRRARSRTRRRPRRRRRRAQAGATGRVGDGSGTRRRFVRHGHIAFARTTPAPPRAPPTSTASSRPPRRTPDGEDSARALSAVYTGGCLVSCTAAAPLA